MKSVEVQFNEALKALDKAGKRKQYDEKAKGCTTIEAKLNCAEEVLKEQKIVRESVKKHNGVSDNRGELITEANSFSEGYVKETTDPYAKVDGAIFDMMESRGEITAEQKRQLRGLPPTAYDSLSVQQKRDYNFARAVGMNESDSLRVAKMTIGCRR